MGLRAILVLGVIMLTCGSAGLIVVRLTSPLLLGIGWLGCAFASGAVGAGLLLGGKAHSPAAVVILAEVFVLGSFVFLHVALLELLEHELQFPVFGAILLLLQLAIGFGLLLLHHGDGYTRTFIAGIFIAAQAGETLIRLLPHARGKLKVPGSFVALLLALICIANVTRSGALLFGYFRDRRTFDVVEVATFALSIAVALGLGFGVFWMTTTALTAELEQAAATDPLTRTYNRRVFLRWCDRERERYGRTGAPFSVLMIDFDHFKTINDTFGHHAGDEVLVCAVERMQDAIRGIDVLGRWGGEEFAALLPNASLDSAMLVAERLRNNVARMRLPHHSLREAGVPQTIQMTVSIGIATFASQEDTVANMLRRADAALYQAKATGRNRVVAGPQTTEHGWMAHAL